MNLGMGKSIGMHDVEYQSQESVHVLAKGTSTLALAFRLNLLAFAASMASEAFYGLMGLLSVIDKIKSHLFTASKGGLSPCSGHSRNVVLLQA